MTKFTKSMILILITLITTQVFADKLLIDDFIWTNDAKLDLSLKQRITPTDPPSAPVRAVAEFEPASAVIIRYPLGIPTSFVALLSQEIEVICIVSSSWQQTQAQNSFNSAGVNNDNLSFIIANTDSFWTRDYTSWFVINGDQQMSVLDFEYNRETRPNDNLFPQAFAQEYDYPYYAMNLMQTGGNFMTDGYGIAVSSHIAYTENGNNPTFVNNTMQNYMGIDDYMVIQDPNGTYIDHVDCWGKFLDVDKILIRELPPYEDQYEQVEAVADYFASTNCAWGYPYEVIRVYTPDDQPYTNSLILNDRVFVPLMNSIWDDDAIETYQNAMPGYRIYGVYNNTYQYWQSTDALHCRTHEIPDRDMLSIQHYPYYGSVDDELVTIQATITALSGEEIYADSTIVYYKAVNASNWQYSSLEYQGDDTWATEIGPFATNQAIQYYLHSADESGRSEDYPYIGAADPFEFIYTAENPNMLPPEIEFSPVLSIQSNQLPLELTCNVTDPNDDLAVVNLWYDVNGMQRTRPFNNVSDDFFSIEWDIAYDATGDNNISYRIEAIDSTGLITVTPNYSINIVVSNDNNEVAPLYGITSAYPNPFNDSLNIVFKTKTNNQTIKIYNLKGQLVKKIKSNSQSDITTNVKWNGEDRSGHRVSSGVYYMVLESEGVRDLKKVLLLK
ncbi:agmatine deiminase family protein [bacterium]|nr:agmatine deiminase family protein [bacterium]